MKRVLNVTSAPGRHWVGDGFPVHGMFGYSGPGVAERSPFLMLDYAAPTRFEPTDRRRGVGTHPHRGFETVTFILEGELMHRDSGGHESVIRAGGVQWMTAGSGLEHAELSPDAFKRAGGPLEILQLWVNLPSRLKMTPPRYQDLRSSQLGLTSSSDAGALVRVIAGEVGGVQGPGSTYTPMAMVHATVAPGGELDLPWAVDFNALVYVLSGDGAVGPDRRPIGAGQLVVLGRGDFVEVRAAGRQESRHPALDVVVLGGRPIREPVAWGGPFVMNTKAEVLQAFEDYQKGRLGTIPAVHGLSDGVVES